MIDYWLTVGSIELAVWLVVLCWLNGWLHAVAVPIKTFAQRLSKRNKQKTTCSGNNFSEIRGGGLLAHHLLHSSSDRNKNTQAKKSAHLTSSETQTQEKFGAAPSGRAGEGLCEHSRRI